MVIKCALMDKKSFNFLLDDIIKFSPKSSKVLPLLASRP